MRIEGTGSDGDGDGDGEIVVDVEAAGDVEWKEDVDKAVVRAAPQARNEVDRDDGVYGMANEEGEE